MLQQYLLIFKKIIQEIRSRNGLLSDEYTKMHIGYLGCGLLLKTAVGRYIRLLWKAAQKFESINNLKNNKFIMG